MKEKPEGTCPTEQHSRCWSELHLLRYATGKSVTLRILRWVMRVWGWVKR